MCSTVPRVLSPDGTYVIIGNSTTKNQPSLVRKPRHFFVSISNGDSLEVLRWMVESGKVTSVIDREFPVGEVAAPFRYLKVGSPLGKIVLTVGDA